MKPRVAILASGEGTTAEAVIKAWLNDPVAPQVTLVISNKKTPGIFKRITALNQHYGLSIACRTISKESYPAAVGEVVRPGDQTTAEEAALLKILADNYVDLVVLLGYLKRIGPRVVYEYGWRPEYTSPYQARLLNTHCGPLPATKNLWGIHIQEYLVANHSHEAGQTLHVVAEDYDDGPIIAQHSLEIQPHETAEQLFARVQTLEKAVLPADLKDFMLKRTAYLEGKS